MKENFVNYKTALALENLGYSPESLFSGMVYAERTRVRDDAEERFGSLTDDGYYDLTVEGGGTLPWEEVYETSVMLDRPYGFGREVPAPTIYEAASFLRVNNKIHIDVRFKSEHEWEYNYVTMTDGLKHRTMDYYPTYELALSAGVEHISMALNKVEEN